MRVPACASIAIAVLLGCAASTPPSDAGLVPYDAGSTDAPVPASDGGCGPEVWDLDHVQTATPSPDGMGFCCVPGYPTCGCGYFGGFVTDRCDCARIGGPPYGLCDLAPQDWISGTDAHGCTAYHAQSPPTACCNCPLESDAGP